VSASVDLGLKTASIFKRPASPFTCKLRQGHPAPVPNHKPTGESSGEQGQAIVEAAIALPIVCAFVFAMIEICLAFYSFCMISESAREGTRYAIVHGATCQTATKSSCTASISSINTYVTTLGWPNLGNGTITANTSFPDGNQNPGSRVQVKVNYVFPIQLPFVPRNSISMASSSVMYFIQ
jgi:Flp pilus assembly protein TadG